MDLVGFFGGIFWWENQPRSKHGKIRPIGWGVYPVDVPFNQFWEMEMGIEASNLWKSNNQISACQGLSSAQYQARAARDGNQ